MSNGPDAAPSMAAWNATADGSGGGAAGDVVFPGVSTPGAPAAPAQDSDLAELAAQLRDLLGLPVRISFDGDAGAVTISYASLDQLDMVLQRLTGEGL